MQEKQMTEEKQIEELVKDVFESGMLEGESRSRVVAEELFYKGYRKQSKVALEIIGEILASHTPDIDGFFTMHECELVNIKKNYTEVL